MSDVEIIQAVQSSDPTLFSTPMGVLSIIAHYSRPNVFTFPKYGKVRAITTYHYTVEGSTTRSCNDRPLHNLYHIHSLIGVVGNNVYLKGFDILLGWMVYSFSVQTQTFKGLWSIEGADHPCLVSPEAIYEFGPGSRFCMYNLTTGSRTKLPTMVGGKHDPSYFLYKDTMEASHPRLCTAIYVFGGNGRRYSTKKCWRFDIKENKWYDIAPMPLPARGIRVAVKDGCLYLTTAMGYFFMYNMEKDTWTTLKLDKTIAALPVEKLHYNEGRFTVATKVGNSMIIRESTAPEEPWKVVLTIEGDHHVHLTGV